MFNVKKIMLKFEHFWKCTPEMCLGAPPFSDVYVCTRPQNRGDIHTLSTLCRLVPAAGLDSSEVLSQWWYNTAVLRSDHK